MRAAAALLVAVCAAPAAVAQQQPEVLVSGEMENGGFGGPDLRFTSLRGSAAVLVGGRGGWIINHAVVLGGGGYGLVSSVTAPQQAQPALGRYDLSFGYGGVIIEGIILPMRAWHLSVATLFGAGGVSYSEHDSHASTAYGTDTVFVWEPTLSLELNLVSFMRIDVGAGYRVVRGVEILGLANSDLTGPSGVVTFKFGKF